MADQVSRTEIGTQSALFADGARDGKHRALVLHSPLDKKTQAIEWSPMAIDTPGEYLENRCLYSALLTSACEADVIALVLNADAQWSPFSPGFTAPMNRPTIGLVTKADLAEPQRISLVAEWLTQAGARQIFITSALNNSGLDAVLDFLNSKEPLCLTK